MVELIEELKSKKIKFGSLLDGRIRRRLKKGKGLPRQIVFLLQAIKEAELEDCEIEIDIINGYTYIDGEKKGVLFPESMVRQILELKSNKDLEFVFIGKHRKEREWIKKYENKNSIILWKTQDTESYLDIDKQYYEYLWRAEFGLCPQGVEKWTYRFYECCLCKAIPVVDKEEESMQRFMYYKEGSLLYYLNEIVEYNYRRFFEWNTLIKSLMQIV